MVASGKSQKDVAIRIGTDPPNARQTHAGSASQALALYRHTGDDRYIEVRYEELLEDPERVMTLVYDHLGLGRMPSALKGWLKATEQHCPNTIASAPELEERLRDEWAFAFKHWPCECDGAVKGTGQVEGP